MSSESPDITALLMDLRAGDAEAMEILFPLLYDELHVMAGNQMRSERAGHTLSPTALVHEAYLKLIDQRRTQWENRAHFFGIASLVMRRILINHARKQQAARRGGDVEIVTLVEDGVRREARATELLALDEALDRLAGISERASKVVVMRFFGGLSQDEIAEALNVSVPTVQRDWQTARAWLSRELSEPGTA